MATSVLMADTNPRDHPRQPHDHDGGQPKRRSSGRRKIKGSDSSNTTSSGQRKSKQPQRGMGVEKLEKLRLQERWKKMTENLPLPDPTRGFGAPSFGADLGFQYGQVDLFGLGNCDACHKKKKFNGGDCGFLGLNRQVNYQGFDFETKMAQGNVEIVGVHRKAGYSSSSSEGVMMEYEFFPSSCSKSDSDQINVNDDDDDELVMMNLAETPFSSVACYGSSCVDVDLSLKLSY